MTREAVARLWWGATVAGVVLGLGIQVPLSAAAVDDAFFTTPLDRVLNLFAYFTIWSNILVAVVSARLALGRGVEGVAWGAARLAGLVAIIVTFAVYNLALRQFVEVSGLGVLADELFHSVVPMLTVVGWVVFGPRGATSWRAVPWSLAMPVSWTVFTLIRGEVSGRWWYPYPFLDVQELGYAAVALNLAIVGFVFGALASAAHVADRALAGRVGRPQAATGDSHDVIAT